MTERLSATRSRVQALLDQFPYVPRSLALLWKSTGLWTLVWSLLLVLQGVLPVAMVYLTQWIVDGVVEAVAAGGSWENVRPTLMLVALMAAVMLVNELLSSATGWIRAVQSELLEDHINVLIHDKSMAVDLAFYESPEFYDHLHRARAEAKYRSLALLENAGGLVKGSITVVVMAAVLIPFGLWLPVALLLSTLPALVVVVHYSLREHQRRLLRTPDERRIWYYDWLLTSQDAAAAELRLFGLGRHFQAAFQALRGQLREERLRLARNEGVGEAAAGTLGLLITGGALAWMAWRTMQGLVSLGQLALFYQAFYRGQSLMRSLLQNVGQAYANTLFLSNLFEFLDLQPQILDPPDPSKMGARLKEGINFHHVTFRYPGSERLTLHDFSLFIPAGKTVAIVGANGASKSTLLKLICRFYDPEDGRIELDGMDLRAFSLQELRENIAVLLQEPVHYSETVRENIRLGNLGAGNSGEIDSAAKAASVQEIVDRLPAGYDTLLGKRFVDGTELSVGEWKRVCLARSLFRQASIILLDEPTSGMDSWAEAEWMEHFVEDDGGKTAVIITHRFTTAMRADIIHVMKRGHITESGDHEQLLAQKGEYARSWRKQVLECHA